MGGWQKYMSTMKQKWSSVCKRFEQHCRSTGFEAGSCRHAKSQLTQRQLVFWTKRHVLKHTQKSCNKSSSCKDYRAKKKQRKKQGDGFCVSWRHEALLRGREFAFGCVEINGNPADRVCTKAYITHVMGSWSDDNAGIFMLKRTRCLHRKCDVFKRGFCIHLNKGPQSKFKGWWSHDGSDRASKTASFVHDTFKILQAHPNGLPEENRCKDGWVKDHSEIHGITGRRWSNERTGSIETLGLF